MMTEAKALKMQLHTLSLTNQSALELRISVMELIAAMSAELQHRSPIDQKSFRNLLETLSNKLNHFHTRGFNGASCAPMTPRHALICSSAVLRGYDLPTRAVGFGRTCLAEARTRLGSLRLPSCSDAHGFAKSGHDSAFNHTKEKD